MGPQVAPAKHPLLSLEDVSFSYPGKPRKVLRGINLTLEPGEALLLTGPTGCGKSTLLKTMNGIIPLESSGVMEGVVRMRGAPTHQSSLAELAPKAGLVFQSPDDQLFCDSIRDEVAFGPQMLGLSEEAVAGRVSEALRQVGLAENLEGYSSRLSGGQKQRLAIACQLAMHPLLLALDEPISQLDPKGCHEVMTVLAGLRQKGLAIVLVEHRLTEALKLATRVAIMDQGRILAQCAASELEQHMDLLGGLGLKMPEQILERQLRRTVRFSAGFQAIGSQREGACRAGDATAEDKPEFIRLEEIGFSYPRSQNPALEKISLSIRGNEILAVMGANGSGKSTLLGILAGQLKPGKGRMTRHAVRNGSGREAGAGSGTALLLQNPDLLLIEPSLERQLSPPGRIRFKKKAFAAETARRLARRMGLEEWLASPPWALSKGQRLRAALGSLLSIDPDLLLLDEPTTGQNQKNIHRLLGEVLREIRLDAVVICSHDLETVCRFAHRVAVLEKGRLTDLGPVEEVIPRLAGRPDFCPEPPLALRLSRELNLEPPFITMDSLCAFLAGDGGCGS